MSKVIQPFTCIQKGKKKPGNALGNFHKPTYKDGGNEFNPGQLNPTAWYNAANVTLGGLGGNEVSNIIDLSGNGFNGAQTLSSLRPIYTASDSNFNNNPTLNTNGAEMNLSLSVPMLNSTGSFSFFAVGVMGNLALFSTTTGRPLSWFNSATNLLLYTPAQTISFSPFTGGSVSIIFIDCSISRAYENGIPVVTRGAYNNDYTFNKLFNSAVNGTWAEFICFNQAKTNDEINAIGQFLGDKYAITWTDI